MGLVKRLSFMRLLFMRLLFINHRSPTDVSNVPGDSSPFCVLPGLRAITLGLLIFFNGYRPSPRRVLRHRPHLLAHAGRERMDFQAFVVRARRQLDLPSCSHTPAVHAVIRRAWCDRDTHHRGSVVSFILSRAIRFARHSAALSRPSRRILCISSPRANSDSVRHSQISWPDVS